MSKLKGIPLFDKESEENFKAWYDDIELKQVSSNLCSNCGKDIPGGIFNALEHYAECYTPQQREDSIRSTMKELNYSRNERDQFIKNIKKLL